MQSLLAVRMLLCVIGLGSGLGTARGAEVLTIEQTVGVVFAPSHSETQRCLHYANMGARQSLYNILSNRELQKYHERLLWLFAWSGDRRDVPKLIEYYRGHTGVCTPEEYRLLRRVPMSLAIMTARGIGEAEAALDEMTRMAFWSNISFRTYTVGWKGVPEESPHAFVRDALHELLMAGADWRKRMERYLAEIPSGELRASVRAGMESSLEPYAKSDADWAWTKQVKVRVAAPSRQFAAGLPAYFNGDLKKPRPASAKAPASRPATVALAPSTSDSRKSVTVIGRDAAAAFEAAAKLLTDQRHDELAGRLLDNMRPLSSDKLAKKREKFVRSLAIEEQVLSEMRKSKLADGPIQVRSAADAVLRDSDEVPDAADVTVTWVIPGSASVTKQIASLEQQRGSATILSNGDLVVVMKRVNGKWYWNPFGW